MPDLFLDHSGRLRTAWRFLLFGTAALAILIGVHVAIMAGLGRAPRSPEEFLANLHADSLRLVMLAVLPVTALDLGLIWLFRRKLDRRGMASLGFVRPGRAWHESVAVGLVLGVLATALVIGALLAIGGLEWTGVSASARTWLLIPVLVAMAFNEEIVFRGYYLQNLIDIGRPWTGIVFSSTVFCLLHAANPAALSSFIIPLNLFGAGIVFALAYLASGNIWFPTAMHFGWNFAMGVVFEVPISGLATDGLLDVRRVETRPDWLTGGEFGIEGSLLVTAVEFCMGVLFWSVLRKRSPTDRATVDPPPSADRIPASGAA